MATDRLVTLQQLLARSPNDARLRFGIALEYEKRGDWENAANAFRDYLAAADDEGNAWGRLGHALKELGRTDDARQAYQTGVDVARAHGHPSMAAEFEEILGDWPSL